MKTHQPDKTKIQHDYMGKHIRHENKDDLDSRHNEEQDFKKDDMTHNKKETRAGALHRISR